MLSRASGDRFNGMWNYGLKNFFGTSSEGNGELNNGKREKKGTIKLNDGSKY